MSNKEKDKDGYLAIVLNTETGLFHGAVYRNHKTPSGCDRYLLAFTTDLGYPTSRSAGIAINEKFSALEPIDIKSLPQESAEDIDRLLLSLPAGALITHITPQRSNPMEACVKAVEVRAFNSIDAPELDVDISEALLKRLISRKAVNFHSSSGRDPGLYYHYDYYLVA